jgi:hypothetical protein
VDRGREAAADVDLEVVAGYRWAEQVDGGLDEPCE